MQQAWCSCVKVHYLGKGRSTIFFAAEEAGAYCHRGAMAPPGHQAKEAPSNKLIRCKVQAAIPSIDLEGSLVMCRCSLAQVEHVLL